MRDAIEIVEKVGRSRPRRIAFVAEQFVPPVIDGSTYVYKNWIDFLADRYELYAVLFTSRGTDTAEAERYLGERCAAHLILPGQPDSRIWKAARALSRLATGASFAPRWLEEFGRGDIHRAIARFIARYEPELFLVSKLASVPLFGAANLRRRRATAVLDMHDDFIRRDDMERRVLAGLLERFPALESYGRYRDMRLRHLLSRLAVDRARAQEEELYGLFDCVLASAPSEYEFYRSRLRRRVPCELLGWPPPLQEAAQSPRSPAGPARYHAGFIGADFPFNLEGVIFFCNQVLPLIRARRPDFKFLIAGHIAAPLKLVAPDWPGTELCGYVPSARHFYEQVQVSVVPILSGTGVSVKTLEALDFGLPVVSTQMGARGLAGSVPHPRLAIADEPEDFARHVLTFCGEEDCGVTRQAVVPDSIVDFAATFDRLLRLYAPRAEAIAAPWSRRWG